MTKQSNYSFRDGVFIVDQFGCYVKVEDGVIYTAPLNMDDTCDCDWSEVTEPAEGFIEALRNA